VGGAVSDDTTRIHRFAGLELGAFVLEAPLGSGAMGQVYRGRHGPSGLPVAVKVLSEEHADPTSREAFRREVQTAAALHHRHVVPVYDHGTVPEEAGIGGLPVGAPYLVMALAEGGSLLRYARALDWPSIATLLFQLLDALAHAHARGVVHCDLKPENVLLLLENASGGQAPMVVPALADFGIAHAFRSVQATAGVQQVRGTPQFMAPEQFIHPRDIGPATDLYALGCMTYEMVCRRMPFEGASALALGMAHVRGPRPEFTPAIDVPEALGLWIARLLRPDWRARFAGAAEAAFALSRFADTGATGLPTLDRLGISVDLAQFPTVPMASPRLTEVAHEITADYTQRATIPQTWRRVDPLRSASLVGAGRGLFGLRPVPFVAREAERDQIWEALRAVSEGATRVVVLTGETGTGKSRLAEWVAQRADEVGGRAPLLHPPRPRRHRRPRHLGPAAPPHPPHRQGRPGAGVPPARRQRARGPRRRHPHRGGAASEHQPGPRAPPPGHPRLAARRGPPAAPGAVARRRAVGGREPGPGGHPAGPPRPGAGAVDPPGRG
jgi:serine/threonine protein kinase